MKGRETKGPPSTDLLVCFPSRAHLTLMPPKSICSPARPSETNNRHHLNRRLLKKSSTKNGAGVRASPLLWSKNKHMGSSDDTEPTSPKVTCAGQIKVRSKTGSCKSWQSVMEEIERIHNTKQHKSRRPSWVESLGFKKDVMHFLTCLRNIRFDFRCFGAFPQADIITTDDEDEDDDDEEEYQESNNYVDGNEASGTMFSKWFMVLQENQNNGFYKEENQEKESYLDDDDDDGDGDANDQVQAAIPPPNALLLMRCRSAPAKSWTEAKRGEEKEENTENQGGGGEKQEECKREDERKRKNLRYLMEEESRKMKENLVVMKYDSDFYKLSSDIAQETWLVGGIKDPLSRSRSWKR